MARRDAHRVQPAQPARKNLRRFSGIRTKHGDLVEEKSVIRFLSGHKGGQSQRGVRQSSVNRGSVLHEREAQGVCQGERFAWKQFGQELIDPVLVSVNRHGRLQKFRHAGGERLDAGGIGRGEKGREILPARDEAHAMHDEPRAIRQPVEGINENTS